VRGTTFTGEAETLSALKVSRQCPLFLVVRTGWREGEVLGSELCYELRKEVEQGLRCVKSYI
jgi:hypothetical protein